MENGILQSPSRQLRKNAILEQAPHSPTTAPTVKLLRHFFQCRLVMKLTVSARPVMFQLPLPSYFALSSSSYHQLNGFYALHLITLSLYGY